jgi:hypothetical protein
VLGNRAPQEQEPYPQLLKEVVVWARKEVMQCRNDEQLVMYSAQIKLLCGSAIRTGVLGSRTSAWLSI